MYIRVFYKWEGVAKDVLKLAFTYVLGLNCL